MDLQYFEPYYLETDPEKRRIMLEEFEEKRPQETGQLRSLFQLRYRKMRDGSYADRFLGYLLNMKMAANELNRFNAGRNRKSVLGMLDDLCIRQTGVFDEEFLYQEMCHTVRVYIYSCETDKGYGSFMWGFGKKSDSSVKERIACDLDSIGIMLPEYLDLKNEGALLWKAITDTRNSFTGQCR